MFASTAIGVSHLVQSTRAGADYGLALLWAVLLANVLKFPFFEFGSRYAAATGKSIIDGYLGIGRWCLWLYGLLTLVSMFIITAAVTYVTAGFFGQLFNLNADIVPLICLGLLLVVAVFVSLGKFSTLTNFIKILALVLFFSTIAAFLLSCFKVNVAGSWAVFGGNRGDWFFVIALMGWMPTALDLSAWNSLWTVEKIKEDPTLNWAQLRAEFNWGYWVAALLSVVFLFLGMFLLFAKGETLAESAPAFAAGVIKIYTQTFGAWSYWLISASAFSIMLGTMIGVFDGYSRAILRVIQLQFSVDSKRERRVQLVCIWVLVFGSFLLIYFSRNLAFKQLIDFATHVSFLIAPLVAWWNFSIVRKLDGRFRPGKTMNFLAIAGMVYLLFFALVYLYLQFG